MKKKKILTKPVREVRAKLQAGAGRWLLLICEAGHIQKQFPYGDWTEARKKYGRKNTTVQCGRCHG